MRTITIDLTFDDLQMLMDRLYSDPDNGASFKEWKFPLDDGEPIEVEFINDEEYEQRNQ